MTIQVKCTGLKGIAIQVTKIKLCPENSALQNVNFLIAGMTVKENYIRSLTSHNVYLLQEDESALHHRYLRRIWQPPRLIVPHDG